METRPSHPVKLEKGKLIYSAKGFTHFWNWMASFVFNLSKVKGEGIEIDTTIPDKPKFKAVYV